jgi:hypothetical protein
MSEVETDQVDEVEDEAPDGEPSTDAPELPGPDVDGPADDTPDEALDDEPDETDEQSETEAGDEQARQAKVLTEKEIDKRNVSLGKENLRHVTRVGEIMGDDAPDLEMCPMCSDHILGMVYPPSKAPLSEEAVARVRTAVGLPTFDVLVQPSWANKCAECNGNGKVRTGSNVENAETTGCPACNERGWINTRGQAQTNGNLTHPEGEIVTGPTVLGLEPDERVAALQRDGFTVIPPMHFAGT